MKTEVRTVCLQGSWGMRMVVSANMDGPCGLEVGSEARSIVQARLVDTQNSVKESEPCPPGNRDKMKAAELGEVGNALERLTWQLYKKNLVESSVWVYDSLFSNLLV